MDHGIVVIGAGPAGLTAAWELSRRGAPCTVLESDPVHVGGLARTVRHPAGFRFDIGGHRFFSKNAKVEELWRQFLPDDLLEVDRLSRIYFRGRFLAYPLRPFDALRRLGLRRAVGCVTSYLHRRARPIRPERSFRDWVVNRFGDRLFETFFESYTEKVWGIPCERISADWAAQRIRGLSLGRAIRDAFRRRGDPAGGAIAKTLVNRFRYPRLGPGQMWEAVRDRVRARGTRVEQDRSVVRLRRDASGVHEVLALDGRGRPHAYRCARVLSSMPLRDLVLACDPAPPAAVRAAARKLRYRDFLTVALILGRARDFPDQWIYIHDPCVRVGRIQNFRNWSPDLVPDADTTVLGMEYFCFAGDDLWSSPDAELVALAADELERVGLGRRADVREGVVVRAPKAYPVYDDSYREAVARLRTWLGHALPNVAPAGRNGMHKYNNQDHSMLTGRIAAGRLLGVDDRDPWRVNTDAEYHEGDGEDMDRAGRDAPRTLGAAVKP